jgi:hypothetical protein
LHWSRESPVYPWSTHRKFKSHWLTLAFTSSNHQDRRSLYVAVLHIAQGTICIPKA